MKTYAELQADVNAAYKAYRTAKDALAAVMRIVLPSGGMIEVSSDGARIDGTIGFYDLRHVLTEAERLGLIEPVAPDTPKAVANAWAVEVDGGRWYKASQPSHPWDACLSMRGLTPIVSWANLWVACARKLGYPDAKVVPFRFDRLPE